MVFINIKFLSILLYRHDVSITVTSISSRERPRARGAGAPPISSGGSSSPKTQTRVGSGSMQQVQQQYNASVSARSTPQQQQASYIRTRGAPGGGGMSSNSQHLNTPSALYRNSRSLDSGLDEFGAVPFAVSSPSLQTRPAHVAQQTQTQASQVRKGTIMRISLEWGGRGGISVDELIAVTVEQLIEHEIAK